MTRRVLGWLTGLGILVAVLSAEAAANQKPANKPPENPRNTAAKPAPVLKPGKPADHGVREADFDAVRRILQKAVDDKTLPGASMLLVHRGEILFKEAFGDLKVDQPVKLASDSKPVAATVVMIVVEQGKLRLDDPLTKYVPEFKGTKVEKATVRQLLCHAAGIEDKFAGGWPAANTLAEFAAAVAEKGSFQLPGKYRYSSVGIDLACRCAEKAAGRPFEELMNEYLCEPLGMKETRFAWGGDAEAVPKEARQRGEGRYVSGGGGLESTLDDMAVFYQMHQNGGRYGDKQILSRKAVTEMHKKQVTLPGGGAYGLGLVLEGPLQGGVARMYRHGGALGTVCFGNEPQQFVGIFFSQAGGEKSAPVVRKVQKNVGELLLRMR
jgi:CubicO group peptidase (beta-lactamase class C family)